MKIIENWIWLPSKVYPNDQTARFDALSEDKNINFVVAEFKKEYKFDKTVSSVTAHFSADTELQLYCNGRIVATGPSAVGGDFLGNGRAREWYYSDRVEFSAEGEKLEFFARVKMCPTRYYEYSMGHGGFMLCAEGYTAKQDPSAGLWTICRK